MGKKKTKKRGTTRNIHPCWENDFLNGTGFFECEKCGAYIANEHGTGFSYEEGEFYLVDGRGTPDYTRKPRPIIVDGIKFPSINKACEIMDASPTAVHKAIRANEQFRGHTIELDNDPYEWARDSAQTAHSQGYTFIPVQYCPNCGRKVVSEVN